MMARETVDFTKYRKGSKPRSIVIDYCPKCGRKGEKHAYKGGHQMYVHEMQMGIVPIAWDITDSCLIQPVVEGA